MELDELKSIWNQHERLLVENTTLNKKLLKTVLLMNAGKRLDWLKIRTLASMIIPFVLLVFIVIPRLQFTLNFETILGLVLFVPLYVLSYIWTIKVYLLIEKLSFTEPILALRKQVKLAERYKLKITRYGFFLAPFMIVGIFLSAGIPFFSSKMIPFYALMVVSFLIGSYVRSRHGLVVQIRRINRDIEEISKLELESDPGE